MDVLPSLSIMYSDVPKPVLNETHLNSPFNCKKLFDRPNPRVLTFQDMTQLHDLSPCISLNIGDLGYDSSQICLIPSG